MYVSFTNHCSVETAEHISSWFLA